MPLKFQSRLLRHLQASAYEPATAEQLIEDLRFDDPSGFERALATFERDGLVHIDSKGRVKLPGLDLRGGELEGVFRANPKGFGFVETTPRYREGDLFVPPNSTQGAMSGDRVKVYYEADRRGGGFRGGSGAGAKPEQRFTAEVLEILERRRSTFTGEIFKQGKNWLVEPDGRHMNDPIIVRDAESKNVKVGDKVTLEIIEYQEGNLLAEGVITKVLGEAGRPDVETQAIIDAFDLPDGEFPENCVEQARQITRDFDEAVARFEDKGPSAVPDRTDLTGMFPAESGEGELICTIDPPDAKDYDDAVHIRRVPKDQGGGWELGVHIADVGSFIKHATVLDEEAKRRGNSVYLPRLVIPMLPEILSNGICSLQEGVVRFARSAFMRYDSQGNIKAEGVGQTIIRSRRRLTYLEAQALIDGDLEEAAKHCKTEPDYPDEVIQALREMAQLAKQIRARRFRNGMISLDLPDVELIFDEDGHVCDAVQEDDAFTHTLVEMFMVEANEVVARLFERLGVPLLRRVHPEPTPGDSQHVERAAKVAGFTIPQNPTREELQGLLEATRGTPAARAVHLAVLRTLTKAEYSPAMIGHFALASGAYAHFTSPIRRYPDLTVHRATKRFLELTENGKTRPGPEDDAKWAALGKRMHDFADVPGEIDLVTIGRHCSDTEQNATGAERELRQFLVLQLLENHIGEEFDAVVTGVTSRGVFVQIDKYLADGLIPVGDLPGDVTRDAKPPRWKMDHKTGALVDVNSGRSFSMGNLVRVTIAEVDLTKRQMNCVIADGASRAAGKAKKPKLNLDSDAGGLGSGGGAGFKPVPGAQKRSQRSRSRDKRKTDFRQDRKNKGKK